MLVGSGVVRSAFLSFGDEDLAARGTGGGNSTVKIFPAVFVTKGKNRTEFALATCTYYGHG